MSDNYGYICLIDGDAEQHKYQGFFVPNGLMAGGTSLLMDAKSMMHTIGRPGEDAVSGALQAMLFEVTLSGQDIPLGMVAAALIEHTGHRFLEIEGKRQDGGWLTTMASITAETPEDASRILSQRHRQLAAMKQVLGLLKDRVPDERPE